MFNCHFETVNSAFAEGDGRAEVARILRDMAAKIEHKTAEWALLYDINGNPIGEFECQIEDDLSDDEEE